MTQENNQQIPETDILELLRAISARDKQIDGMRKDMDMALEREKILENQLLQSPSGKCREALSEVAKGQQGELKAEFIHRVMKLAKETVATLDSREDQDELWMEVIDIIGGGVKIPHIDETDIISLKSKFLISKK